MRAFFVALCLLALAPRTIATASAPRAAPPLSRAATPPTPPTAPSCETPLTYRIGTIAPEFALSEAEVRTALAEAQAVWNDASERPLFAYAPDGDVVIHLRHDERQARSQAQQRARAAIDDVLSRYEELVQSHRALLREYQQERADYQAASERLEAQRDTLRDLAQQWDEADASKRNALVPTINQKQADIERLKQRVMQQWEALEAQTQQVNALARKINRTVEQANTLIHDYNQQFGDREVFRKGKYVQRDDQRAIVVYQLRDMGDLARVLAHELGHALGLNHVNDPAAIMYYRVTNDNRVRLALSAADREALQDLCQP